MTTARLRRLCLIIICLCLSASTQAANQEFSIKLRTGEFAPDQTRFEALSGADLAGTHVIIQLNGPVTEDRKDQLRQAGISLQGYIPNYAFIAHCEQVPDLRQLEELGVRWLGALTPDQKISPDLTESGFRDYSRKDFNRVQMVVLFHDDVDPVDWLAELSNRYEAEIIGVDRIGNSVDLILPEALWANLAQLEAVQWLEQALPRPVELNNNSRNYTGAAVAQNPPYSLTGEGVFVAEWDGGRADATHRDLANKVTYLDFSGFSTHSTHVAGTVLGTGESRADLRYKGMAPGAELLTQIWWNTSSEMVNEYDEVINNYGAQVSTNSWGYGINPVTPTSCGNTLGTYFAACRTLDRLVRGYAGEPISIVWSAGNERGSSSQYCGSIGWTYNTIGALATSKNVITVGAVSAFSNNMTSFSSWGPTDDGRVKPDVVGPGASVTSCKKGSGYTTMSGTSMSAPAVAGLLALMYEQRAVSFVASPVLPSTMKAILINTAIDMGRIGPDYEFGHGKVDVVAAVEKIALGEASYVEGELSTGETHIYDLTVPGNAERLKVTLVWDDPGGTVSASEHLINNLDLELVDPFATAHSPWILYQTNPTTPATRGVDAINNVETAEVVDPIAGLWKAKITGFNIPDGPQKYSLVFTPDNINTPGNLTAVAVYDEGDLVIDPGATTPLEFYVSNIGASPDSFTVSLSGDMNWLNQAVDTTVYLAPYDSALIASSATVPAAALAGDNSQVQCRAVSMSDTLAVAVDYIVVTAAQVFATSVSTNVIEETINSPDTFSFQVTVTNLGNATDIITIEVSGETDWAFSPASRNLFLEYQADTTLEILALIPAEVLDGSDNLVNITATTSGGPQAITSFNLVGHNPFFPPTLISPLSPSYTQDATPLFEWSSDGDSYNLYIADDSLISNVLRTVEGITDSSVELTPGESLTDGIYFWGVKKFVGTDSSSLQRFPFKLMVDNTPPAILQPVSPNNTYSADSILTFYWVIQPGQTIETIAPEYNILRTASDSNLTTDLTVIEPLSASSHVPDPFGLGRWYWSVQSADSAGNFSAESSVATFVVDNEAPIVPYDLIPADSSAVDGDTILFTWSIQQQPPYETAPHYYYLHISDNPGFGDYSTLANFVYTDTVKVPSSSFEEFAIYWWRVKAYDSAGFYSDYSPIQTFSFGVGLCGDFTGDTKVNLADITALIAYVYLGGSGPIARSVANVNCDSRINLADITKLIDHVYISKAPLCCSEP